MARSAISVGLSQMEMASSGTGLGRASEGEGSDGWLQSPSGSAGSAHWHCRPSPAASRSGTRVFDRSRWAVWSGSGAGLGRGPLGGRKSIGTCDEAAASRLDHLQQREAWDLARMGAKELNESHQKRKSAFSALLPKPMTKAKNSRLSRTVPPREPRRRSQFRPHNLWIRAGCCLRRRRRRPWFLWQRLALHK